MKSGSESWYLSAKRARGSVRWACSEQERSSVGGVLELILSWSVGCRPVGSKKEDVNVDA